MQRLLSSSTLLLVFAMSLGTVVGSSIAHAGAGADRTGPPRDAYGYTLVESPAPECASSFVDIRATGTPLTFTASGDGAASDDGGAVLALQSPFELYGEVSSALVVSTNGYLAVASSLSMEDGGDFSNDVRLPAIPGNAAGIGARVLVYHDDLSGTGGGDVHHQHFAVCPRSAHGFDEACTVLQWSSWGFADRADVLDVQALLYHTSSAVVLQVGSGDSMAGSTATRGLQRGDAQVALQHRGAAPGGTALCFFDPRFPAGGRVADLSVRLSDHRETVAPGEDLSYVLVVSNAGPSPVVQAALSSTFPANLESCAWTCVATAGSSCMASGAGSAADSPSLAVGGSATYTVGCRVVGPPPDPAFDVVVTLTAPVGVSDPEPASNTAVDQDRVTGSVLFADGFESGGVGEWSGASGL